MFLLENHNFEVAEGLIIEQASLIEGNKLFLEKNLEEYPIFGGKQGKLHFSQNNGFYSG